MRKTEGSAVVALVGLLLVLAGCSEVGITGRKQLSFVPASLVTSMSLQQYDQLIAQSKLSTDAQATAMVKRVGEKIVQAVEEYSKTHSEKDPFAGYKWEFNLIQDPNVNAFAMPGGKVVVYTGILPVTQNEAGLATVLGHEIAHVYAGHGGERLSQSLLTQMGEVGLSAALQKQPEQTKSLFIGAYGLGTQVGFLLPFSRVHENEADHLGLIFMAMAGYDPHAGGGLLGADGGGQQGPGQAAGVPEHAPGRCDPYRRICRIDPGGDGILSSGRRTGQKPPAGQSKETAPSIFPPAIK